MSQADSLAQDLRSAFEMTRTASVLSAPMPHTQLLEMIVRTAAQVIHARAGSLLLVDEATQELVFEVATLDDVSSLKQVRIPVGQGIAGLVAVTGQPMAVADAQADPRHAREIAQQTGYLPGNLVCVPLEYEDRVIGVIELMDKQHSDGFDTEDIHALGLFASQAAVAIQFSRAQRNLGAFLEELLRSLGAAPREAAAQSVLERVRAVAAELETDQAFLRSIEMAQLIHAIARYGDDEAVACLTILRGFRDYLSARRQRTEVLTGQPRREQR